MRHGWVNTPPAKQKVRRCPRAKRVKSTGGCFGLTDELRVLIEPLLPLHGNSHSLGGGRPRVLDRVYAEAIFFVLRTGCQWNARDVTGLCASSTTYDRFQAWVQAGFFLRFWQRVSMDGAITKAPLARKNRAQPRGPQQARHQTLVARGGWRLTHRLVGGWGQL